jgi:hypothetical protein
VYVLEPHPSESNILLSGAHDGRLIIWDMHNKAILAMHYNHIEGIRFVTVEMHPWVKNILLSGSLQGCGSGFGSELDPDSIWSVDRDPDLESRSGSWKANKK